MILVAAAIAFILATTLATTMANAQQKATPTPETVFVVNVEDSSVSVIDYRTLTETRRLHVGPRPYYVAVSGDNATLAVTVEGEECIKFYDARTLDLRGSLRIGRMYADHMLTLPDGQRLILSDRYGDAVVIVDFGTMKELARIRGVSQPHNIRIGTTGRFAYVTTKMNPGITVIDLELGAIRTTIPMKLIPRGLAVSSDETRIYCGGNWINALFEYDAFSGKLLRVFNSPPPASAPMVQESTYHGLEFMNDSLLLATNEGNSTLDLFNVRTGAVVSRSTDVAGPGAICRLSADRFLFTNLGDNTIVLAELMPDFSTRTVRKGSTGKRIAELPKRFAFSFQ
jgi:YVTN family beta-propeller protein